MEGVLFSTVAPQYARAFARRAASNGASCNETAYLERWHVEEGEWLTRRQWRDLDAGWSVRFLCDPWQVAHLWGYDAHTVVEDGASG